MSKQAGNPPQRSTPPSHGPIHTTYTHQTYTHQPEVHVTTQAYTTTQEANVTVVTHSVVWYEGWNFYVGMIVWSAFAILCCFPLGIAAVLVSIWAYFEFSSGNLPKALQLTKITAALAATAFVCGVIIYILGTFLYYI